MKHLNSWILTEFLCSKKADSIPWPPQSIQFILSSQMMSLKKNISLKCNQITSFSLKALSHSSWHWPAEAQGAGWVSLQGSDEPSWWQTSLLVKISLQFSASAPGPACNVMIHMPACQQYGDKMWEYIHIHSFATGIVGGFKTAAHNSHGTWTKSAPFPRRWGNRLQSACWGRLLSYRNR